MPGNPKQLLSSWASTSCPGPGAHTHKSPAHPPPAATDASRPVPRVESPAAPSGPLAASRGTAGEPLLAPRVFPRPPRMTSPAPLTASIFASSDTLDSFRSFNSTWDSTPFTGPCLSPSVDEKPELDGKAPGLPQISLRSKTGEQGHRCESELEPKRSGASGNPQPRSTAGSVEGSPPGGSAGGHGGPAGPAGVAWVRHRGWGPPARPAQPDSREDGTMKTRTQKPGSPGLDDESGESHPESGGENLSAERELPGTRSCSFVPDPCLGRHASERQAELRACGPVASRLCLQAPPRAGPGARCAPGP